VVIPFAMQWDSHFADFSCQSYVEPAGYQCHRIVILRDLTEMVINRFELLPLLGIYSS
jgi:hypothetical protein